MYVIWMESVGVYFGWIDKLRILDLKKKLFLGYKNVGSTSLPLQYIVPVHPGIHLVHGRERRRIPPRYSDSSVQRSRCQIIFLQHISRLIMLYLYIYLLKIKHLWKYNFCTQLVRPLAALLIGDLVGRMMLTTNVWFPMTVMNYT